MRYEIGEKVSLTDDLEDGDTNLFVTYINEMSYMKEKLNEIKKIQGIAYVVDDERGLWLINDYMIDHEKTIRLRELEENNDNKS